MTQGELVRRKNDHLDIVLKARDRTAASQHHFAAYRFSHCALPELHLDHVDLRAPFLGKMLQAPILISSMTGGAERAAHINRHLAEAAEELGIALAVGSQRIALQTGADHGLSQELRRWAPNVPLLANIGAAQLASEGEDWAHRAIEMIDGDALIVHLNPLQEAVQHQGDRDWRQILVAIEKVASKLARPIVVKEVGAGISATVGRQLVNAGVSVIDVAGAGGTSWARVEAERAVSDADRRVAMAFADWGIPTDIAIREMRNALPETPLIASGGIRDGVDAAKAIRLGADLIGQAASVLTSALQSTEAVVEHFQILIRQLRIACFCTGSASLAALRRVRIYRDGVPMESSP